MTIFPRGDFCGTSTFRGLFEMVIKRSKTKIIGDIWPISLEIHVPGNFLSLL